MKSLKEIAEKCFLNEEQLETIKEIILDHGHYSQEAVRKEIDWYCTRLGMDEYYFKTTPIATIASHIEALKAAEIIANVQKEKLIKIDIGTESENEAIYLVDDYHYRALETEKRIEKKYPNYRLQSYRSLGKAAGVEHLRMYLVYKPSFHLGKSSPEETDLEKIADKEFLRTATDETRQRYQDLLNKSKGWETPLIEISHKTETNELRIMIVTERDTSKRFFSNVSDVLNSHNIVSNRKFVEQFANGKTVYVIYLPAPNNEELIQDLAEDISLVYVIPESPLSGLFREGKLDAQETVFGVSAWSFSHQFLSGYNEEYLKLTEHLKDSPELLGILRSLKTNLAKDTYTEPRVWEAFLEYPEYLKKLFKLFDNRFNPFYKEHDVEQEMAEAEKELTRCIPTDIDREIFATVILFIKVIQRTNFFKKNKTSLAFMYTPEFLNKVDYPETPFGLFHVVAAELRGFHIRFRDIARGGIRVVRSNNIQNYLYNSDFIFDENYNLALTQQRKNKDIPEGGSKGTILLRWGYQDQAETAFKKYINGLLDLLLPDDSIIDYYGKEAILFLGPDEGTAELMEWAALQAKARGYSYWRAFSTGKPVSMGGIPHDLYGMTTNSVHQYVLNVLEKEDIKEENITKVMTGGPDGDLGSNEILISRDKILAIVDGSGVLYDPEGINREELTRLAKERLTIEHFKRNLLSRHGFCVTIKDKNVSLPDGEKIVNGLEFRNTFHLNPKFKADLFVPCGGRPSSININNWKQFIDDEGRPKFKFIAEGANLFITQQARLRLEEHGVIIYKDASANKGGVTSSSLEVFASLALSDDEYDKLMCVKDGQVPVFRKKYIEEIVNIIKENASLEFEIIWKENKQKHISRAVLSDLISKKINAVTDGIYSSELMENKSLFRNIIEDYCPSVLIEEIGLDKVFERVPDSYLKAIFASRLASRYVYRYGLDANEINFYAFLKEYQ
ncbi:MAG: NAD-glutamate dehydrogenase [Candidatus Aminicenantes bacterium]|nr:NAD-glutamate dehydrogenase [Candidatus Aminicenantes bacterium]